MTLATSYTLETVFHQTSKCRSSILFSFLLSLLFFKKGGEEKERRPKALYLQGPYIDEDVLPVEGHSAINILKQGLLVASAQQRRPHEKGEDEAKVFLDLKDLKRLYHMKLLG